LTYDTSNAGPPLLGRDQIANRISNYLAQRLGIPVAENEDIYERGLVSSMFAMELVVQLEQAFGIEIVGSDLQLANFRSVETMTTLVHRLEQHA
jgi:methoxymalonate biosynthesis acyl carrier protein